MLAWWTGVSASLAIRSTGRCGVPLGLDRQATESAYPANEGPEIIVAGQQEIEFRCVAIY